MNNNMKVITQEDKTGCGIASVANVINLPYADLKKIANSLGIFAMDKTLYSDTNYVRRLLAEFDIKTSNKERLFTGWNDLPNLALLSIKHHEEENIPVWHWVVFKRINGKPVVFDSAIHFEGNQRFDFDAMQPKWYIEFFKT